MNGSKFLISMRDFFRIYVFIRNGFNKLFLLEFYHQSSVEFCYLKCGTCVFRKPDQCCLCSCCRIAISLVIFARESDSFFNEKPLILDILYLLYLLYKLRDCLFQCLVCNVHHEDRELIFRMRRGMGIDRLV